MTLKIYTNKILPDVLNIREDYWSDGREFTLTEDGDKGHDNASAENITHTFKDENDLDYIKDWSPYSPDLNPIENVWRIIKKRVKSWHPQDAKELKWYWLEEWEALTFDEINDLILGSSHMRKRLQECIDRKGLSTRY